MNEKLIKYLKEKPKEYETTMIKFWDDEHISKGMLEAHLNSNLDSATRNIDFVKKSVAWIASFGGEKLLDLGCGPGIYSNMLDDKGYNVIGIDFSQRSIDYAKKQNPRISYLYQDYLTINYNNEFDIITLIFCDFGVLDYNKRYALVSKIHRALKSGGKFIVDVFTSNQYKDFKETRTTTFENNGYWSKDEYLNIFSTYQYSNTYLEQFHIITKNDIKCYNLWNHAFTDDELIAFFKQFNFSNIELFDDVSGKEKTNTSPTRCVVVTK